MTLPPPPTLHELRADDRGDDRDAAQHERDGDPGAAPARLLREQHAGHERHRVGLEEVGRHAGVVADVVAHVVGDHGRVARIVLGDARLDLADEVGADVGALREDAAAEAREDRDQRAAEGEAHERVHGRGLRDVAQAQGAVVAGDAQQAEADDEDARHGAALEGDVEGLREAGAARLGDARVGAHRRVHADVAGERREHGADDEAECDLPAEIVRPDARDQQQRRDDHRHDADRAVLAVEVGRRTLLDRRLDLAHALVAGRLLQHPARQVRAVGNGQQATDQGEEHVVLHQERLHDRLCSLSRRNQPDAARQA